ncbi:hypothetical protein FOA52_002217 [Chlamydomonas sp. UWO 241]|nr:hypothetical protein FOA52_002217 [Chlamydomonas sp. UWO 241]
MSEMSDSSETDSEEVPDLSVQDMEALMKYESELEANPNLYDTHVQYVELLRRCGLHFRLRAAHERMASLFPLSEALWTDWANDELGRVSSHEDIERIQALFAQATGDYLSVNLWCQYLDFVREFDPEVTACTAAGIKKFRELCEASLTAAGLHVTEAGRLWAIYRTFELSLEEAGTGGDKHEDRVRTLFGRQLAVPLSDGDATMEAYAAWEKKHGNEVPAHVSKAAAKAVEAASLRAPYEAAVSHDKAADAALLAAHMAYIKLEQAGGEPARVQCAYERAVAVFPVTHELWLQYARYLEVHLKIASVISKVYARALRNCYWVGALWARAIRAASRCAGAAGGGPAVHTSVEAQQALYARAMGAGLQDYECYMQVMLARLDGLRHAASLEPDCLPALRAAFAECAATLASYFPAPYLDRSLRLPAYRAHCEAVLAKDAAAARKVWDDTLKGPAGRFYEAWAAYAAMERGLRNLREARGVYKRAYSRKLEEGGQYTICADWLKFEREEGTPDDFLAASLKVDPIMDEAAAAAAAAADSSAAAAAKEAAKAAPQLSQEDVARMRRESDPNFGKKAAKAAPAKGKPVAAPAAAAAAKRAREPGGGGAGTDADGKRLKLHGSAAAASPAAPPATEGGAPGAAREGGPGGASVPAATASAPAPADADAEMAEASAGGGAGAAAAGPAGAAGAAGGAAGSGAGEAAAAAPPAAPRTIYTDEMTVFVKGLWPAVTDAELAALFEPCGGLKEVRTVRDAEGLCRSFAYVDFSTQEGLAEALKLGGVQFQGRGLFIARSEPKSRPPGSAATHGGGRGDFAHGGGRSGRGGARGGDFGRGGGARGDFGGRGGHGGRGDHGGGSLGGGGGFHGGRGGRGGDGDGGRFHGHGGGGRGGGRGGRWGGGDDDGGRGDGGRGRGGLGYSSGGRGGRGDGGGGGGGEHSGRGGGGDGGGGDGGTMRAPAAFVPRSVAHKAHAGVDGGGAGGGQPDHPKSNDDFRKMLLGGKK